MKNIRKTRLSIALCAATIFGASTLAAAPQDPSQDPNGNLAGNPLYVASNGLGQALIFPYYTVRDQQRTAINIMNTSADTIAMKVTLREGKNSRDVLNFYVLMSPYDVWTGYLSDTNGTPTLHRSSDEDSCVIGAFGKLENNTFTSMASFTEALSTNGLVDTSDIDTLREGYITAIAAGKVDTTAAASDEAKAFAAAVKHGHASGTPADCQAANAPFTVPAGATSAVANGAGTAANGNTAVLGDIFNPLALGENPLKGNLSILDANDGVAGGTQATALANFNQSADHLVAAQVFPYYFNPSLASANGLCSDGINLVENALRANSVINEWSNTANASTDWVITFPTRGFHTDVSATTAQSVGYCNTAGLNVAAYGGLGTNKNKIYYTMDAVDREEKESLNAPVPSPGTNGQAHFANEVNVVTFDDATSTAPSALGSMLAAGHNYDLNAAISGTMNGWADITLLDSALAQRGAATTGDAAMLGFVWKVRKQPGAATTNFGQIIDHSMISTSQTPAIP